MINFKQEELGRQLFDTLQARYPDLELVKITEESVLAPKIFHLVHVMKVMGNGT